MKSRFILQVAALILIALSRILCSIKILSLRSELITHSCFGIGQGPEENTNRKGWLLSTLFGADKSTYVTMSFGLWYKFVDARTTWQINIGISRDKTVASMVDTKSGMSFWHNGGTRELLFQSMLRDTHAEITYPATGYINTWKSLTMYYNFNTGGATMIINNPDGTNFATLNMSPGQFRFPIDYPNSFINADYAMQGGDHLNSCAKHKDLQFHYSVDENYTAASIHSLQFERPTHPVIYYDFRIWNADSSTIQALSQKFKNLATINDKEAINGVSDQIDEIEDVSFPIQTPFIPIFQSNQFITLPSIQLQYSLAISFIPGYNPDDFVDGNQMRIFYQSDPVIEVFVTYSESEQQFLMYVTIGSLTSTAFSFGQSLIRHTIQFQRDDTTFTTTFVKYFVGSNFISQKTMATTLAFGSSAYLGYQPIGYIAFTLQDFIIFTNSQLGSTSIFPNDLDLQLSGCDLYISVGVLNSQSYCLVCSSASQAPTTQGICRDITSPSVIEQIPVVTPLLTSDNIRHVYSTSRSTSTSIDITKSTANWDFLVMGYFKLTSETLAKPMSLILIEVPDQFYYFLHLMVINQSTIKLKQHLNQQESQDTTSIQFSTSLVGRWVAIGLGYKSASSISFLIYDNPNLKNHYMISELSSSYVLDTTYSSLRVTISPSMTYSPWYQTFDGESSTVKIVYNFDASRIWRFIYVLEKDRTRTPLYNGISSQSYSQQISSQFIFECKPANGLLFEGTCITTGNCSKQTINGIDALGVNNAFYDDTLSKSCRICDGNCQTCSLDSKSCLTCRDGMYLDGVTSTCLRCSEGLFFSSAQNSCISDCDSDEALSDSANRNCVSSFDGQIYSILPNLEVRQFEATLDLDFQTLSATLTDSRIVYQCWIPDSYYPYNFLGSSGQNEFTFLWENLPKNYAKEVTFILLVIDSSALEEVTFSINGLTPEISTSIISSGQASMCFDSGMGLIGSTMNIYEVTLSLVNNSDNLELSISSTTQIIGIRNIKPLAKRCSPSCNSCSGGGGSMHCLSCLQSVPNVILVRTQCVCPKSTYQNFKNCYSSPCYECTACATNCVSCEDVTGKCLVCASGFLVHNGSCVATCPTDFPADSYYDSSSGTSQFCTQQRDLLYSQLQDHKIRQFTEFWSSPSEMTSPSSCFGNKYFPNFTMGQKSTFETDTVPFQTYHVGFEAEITLLIIDTYDPGSDYAIVNINNVEQLKKTYPLNKDGGKNGCGESDYADGFYSYVIGFNTTDTHIKFDVIGAFDEASGETMTFEKFKLFQKRSLDSLCAVVSNDRTSCETCMENSIYISNKCTCNLGYFYEFDYVTSRGRCSPCYQSCKSCIGPSAYDCLSCATNYFNNGQLCVYVCADGLYRDQILNKCVPCNTSCLSCTGPESNQCTSCYKGMYLYNRVCYSSCASANLKTIENEFKRTCETPNEVTQLSVFSKQTDYFPEQISKYIRTSDSLNLDVLFACESSPVFNTLGLFNNQMLFTTPILGPHQALRYSFLLYSKCNSAVEQSCSMNIQVVDGEDTLQTISFAPTVDNCAISKLHPVSIVLNHQTTAVATYQILISSSDLIFSVSSIQISTIICHITCKSCKGPLITDCTSCPLNSTLDLITSKCACDDSTQGFGTDSSIECTDPFSCLMCLPCISPCETCFKTDTQSCNSCSPGKFLISTTCADSCPANTTIPVTDQVTGISKCDPCPSPCATCNLFGICSSCIGGYLYIPDQQVCALACPVTQYYQKVNECLPCLLSCYQCNGALPTDCSVCNPGYYMDLTMKQCLKCNDSCSTCTGPLATDCVECAPGMIYFKPYPTKPLHYCTSICTEVPGFYSSYPSCLPCNSTCSGCSGSGISDCSECIDGYYLSQGSCLQCNNQCLTCTGSSSDECASCATPLFLNGSQCSGNCLKGTYGVKNPITGTFSCITCPETCPSCESETICTSCALGFYLSNSSCLKCEKNCEICFSDQGSLCQKCNKGFYLQQQLCYSDCPSLNEASYYGDTITRMCKICDSSCKTCSGSLSFQCLSCAKGSYLSQGSCLNCPNAALSCKLDSESGIVLILECALGLFLYNGSCYQSCPQGTYQKGVECFDCDVSCRSCLDGTNKKCQMCAKGYTLLDNSQTCQACSAGGDGMGDCEQCSSTDVCDKCTSLILYNNKCLESCPATFYQDSVTKMCKKCQSPCLECSAPTTCTSCAAGFYKNGTACLKCNAVCSTCTGGEPTNCTLCASGLLVQVKSSGSICTKTCDAGYFADTELKVCSECDKSCVTCQDSKSCDLCAAGFFKGGDKLCVACSQNCILCTTEKTCQECITGSFLLNGSCVKSCPAGTIGIGTLCVPCISECLECSGTPSTCTKCPTGSYLSNSRCYSCNSNCTTCTSSTVCTACNKGLFLEDGQCKTQCMNAGTFSDTTSMTCQPCDASCATCIGPFPRQCSSCPNGKFLSRIDEGISLGICDSCHTTCSTCFGSSNTECYSCTKGVKYTPANTTCLANLSSYYYDEVAEVYKKCAALCKECTGPDENNCLSCKDKYFYIPTESICTLCPDTCTKCSSSQKCVACKEGYALLENSKCLNSCPNGMRMQNGVCICHSTCAKCEYNEIVKSSVCRKCAKQTLYLTSNSPSCIEKSYCNGFTDEQTQECLDSCPASKFEDRKNKTCSTNPCPGDTYTLSNKYCVESCPEGTFTDAASKNCIKCDSKCKSCIGPSDSECNSCNEGKLFHKSLTSCKDLCMIGYVQADLAVKECTLCLTNCKICQADLYSFERACVTECPIGYKAAAKKCIKNNYSSVRIKKLKQSKISIESDLEVEAELSTKFSNPTISWKNSFTTDSNFSTKFSSISSQTLVQFIPYILLSSGNKYTLQVLVSLPDGTLLMDEVSFETELGIKQGQFVVDVNTGVANLTPFLFSFSGWAADQPLYFSLNFYELVGLISAANLTSTTPSEYLKENLFQLHSNTTLDSSRDVQVQMTFPAFNRDINIIAELHVHNVNQTLKMFSYLMIDLKAVSSTANKLLALKSSLDSLNDATNQLNVLLYTINFNKLIPQQNDKLATLSEQQNLRTQARRMKISTAELTDCDSSIDCFGNGQCVEDMKSSTFTCECDGEFVGTNCEWTQKEASIISDSAIKLATLVPNLSSPTIQLQIYEVIISYATYFASSNDLKYLIANTQSALSTNISTFINRKPDAITGQLISRCLSTSISTLQSIGQNVKALLKLQSEYAHSVSNNLNVGESLLTSSESCESLLKPLLIQPSSSRNSKRLLADESFELNVQDMSIQFPPEVVQNNKKQVVQVQKWKQPSRSNPNAISQSVSISMSQAGSEVPVNNLSVPIIFTLPKSVPSPVSSNSQAILCTYYDESTSSYSSEGCTFVKETITDIVCSCTHLTEFQAAINPSIESEAVSIATFLDTFNAGKKVVLSKQNTKQVVSKLPTIKLGARSVTLTSQLVNMVTTKKQIMKQVMILTENESLSIPNFNLDDRIDLVGERDNNVNDTSNIAESVWNINKKYFLIYALCILTIGLFLSVRAVPSQKFIPILENGDIDDEDGQQQMTIEVLLMQKIKRQKEEMIKRYTKSQKQSDQSNSIVKEQANKKPKKAIQSNLLQNLKQKLSTVSVFSPRSNQLSGNRNRKITQNIEKYEISVIEEEHSEEADASVEIVKTVNSKGLISFSQEASEYNYSNRMRDVFSSNKLINNKGLSKDAKVSLSSFANSSLAPSTSDNFSATKKDKKQNALPALPVPHLPTPQFIQQKHLPKIIKFENSTKNSLQNPPTLPPIPNSIVQKEEYQHEISFQSATIPHPLDESRKNLKIVQACYNDIYSIYNDETLEKELEDSQQIEKIKISKEEQKLAFLGLENLNVQNNQQSGTASKNQSVYSQSRLYLSLIERRNTEEKKLVGLKNKEIMRVNTEHSENEKMLTELSNSYMIIQQAQIKKEIVKCQSLITGLTNQIHSILGISLSEIFQISSLMKSYDRLFSSNFTKCVLLATQLSLTLFANVLKKCLDEVDEEEELSDYSFSDLVFRKRVIVSLLFGYAIPFFFFGLLTSIFAKLSKEIETISIRTINLLRSRFILLFSGLGILMFGISIAGLSILTQSQVDKIEISLAIEEFVVALLIQFVILDGLCFISAFYYDNFEDKKSMVHYILACRGYYYFEGFDNTKTYKYYYEHKYENESSTIIK